MTDEDLDGLIAGAAPPEGPGAPVEDPGLLEAWRRQALSAEAAAEVEAELLRNPEARAELGRLAEPVPPALLERMAGELPSARRRWWPVVALAAAAVLAAVLIPRGAGLPAYELEGPLGGVERVRGEGPASLEFRAHSQLRLIARPKATLEGTPPQARAFVASVGGALRALPEAQLSQAASGAYVLSGPASSLVGPQPGRYVLVIALAAEEAALQALAGKPLAEAADVALLSAELTYQP